MPAATVSERIKSFNAHRLQWAVQLKYALMAQDAFRFYRGTCHIFYEDLFHGANLPPSPATWMCGDLHVENFGSYKGDNRLVYFDINDFDESILGPCLWEAARMATSIAIAFQTLGAEQNDTEQVVRLFIKHYAKGLASGKPRYVEIETARGIVRSFLEKVGARTSRELLQKRVYLKKGRLRFRIDEKKYFTLDKEKRSKLMEEVQQWLTDNHALGDDARVLDACVRIAGTGSIGIRRYALLVQARRKNKQVYRLLDMKEAIPSALQPYVMQPQPAWPSQAERVIAVKTRMQNVSPAFLSSLPLDGCDFLVQEMQPAEDKITFDLVRDRPRDLEEIICTMASLTASAQLRSSGRQQSAVADELIGFGEDASWQQPLFDLAMEQARQTSSYYHQYLEDHRSGFFNIK
jgi:uncharacterized protein (DUF2252 family)